LNRRADSNRPLAKLVANLAQHRGNARANEPNAEAGKTFSHAGKQTGENHR
jgi:hypothetical protein